MASEHEAIWEIQKQLNFVETAYSFKVDNTESQLSEICKIMGKRLKTHKTDREIILI